MNVLILKLNATGDVVRTTCLLRRLEGDITWITASSNLVLLGASLAYASLHCVGEPVAGPGYRIRPRDQSGGRKGSSGICAQTFAANRYLEHTSISDECVRYTDDARRWFDMSLISVHGRQKADELKLLNRRSYQQLIFEGLGFRFENDRYVLPQAVRDRSRRGRRHCAVRRPGMADEELGTLRRSQGGTPGARAARQRPAASRFASRASGRHHEPPLPGRRRQSADAPGARCRHPVRHFVQLHESMGNSRLRDSDQDHFASCSPNSSTSEGSTNGRLKPSDWTRYSARFWTRLSRHPRMPSAALR